MSITIAKYNDKHGRFQAGDTIQNVDGKWVPCQAQIEVYSRDTLICTTTDPDEACLQAEEYTDGVLGGEFIQIIFGYKRPRRVNPNKVYEWVLKRRPARGFTERRIVEGMQTGDWDGYWAWG